MRGKTLTVRHTGVVKYKKSLSSKERLQRRVRKIMSICEWNDFSSIHPTKLFQSRKAKRAGTLSTDNFMMFLPIISD